MRILKTHEHERGSFRDWLRSPAQQEKWFDLEFDRLQNEVEDGTFAPRLSVMVRNDGFAGELEIDISEYVKPEEPVYRFREFFESLRLEYDIFGACVSAALWAPEYTNECKRDTQIVFIGETSKLRSIQRFDVAFKRVVNVVKLERLIGELYERFRHMVYRDPAHPKASQVYAPLKRSEPAQIET